MKSQGQQCFSYKRAQIMTAIIDPDPPPETPTELLQRIQAVLTAMPTAEAEARLLPHLEWQLDGILDDLTSADLLPAELLVVVAVLVPAHSRRLVARILPGGQPFKPRLVH